MSWYIVSAYCNERSCPLVSACPVTGKFLQLPKQFRVDNEPVAGPLPNCLVSNKVLVNKNQVIIYLKSKMSPQVRDWPVIDSAT